MENGIKKLIIYPKENGSGEQLVLTKLTECLNYVFEKSIKNKNIIVVYPENEFRPAVLLAYLFMKQQNKDVLFFTSDIGERKKNPYKNHLENFCLLQEENKIGLIWHYCLPCLFNDNSLKVDLIFRDCVKNANKKLFKEELKEKLEQKSSSFNKLIFSEKMLSNENLNELKEFIFENEEYSFQNKLGLCIFENLSNKIFTEDGLNSFAEWLKQFEEKGIQSIIHLSNYADTGFITRLKEKTNSIVFYISPDFLFKGKELFFKDDLNLGLSSNYNLDVKTFYKIPQNRIKVISIDGKGFSTWDVKKTLEQLEKIENIPPIITSRIKKLLFLLPKLLIHPSMTGRILSYKFEDGNYKTITIPTFFDEINDYIRKTKSKNVGELLKLRDLLVSLYSNLDETDRFGENHPYLRKTKPYIIIELLKELVKEGKNKEIILAVYDGREKNVLKNLLEKEFPKQDYINVKTINQLSYLKEDDFDSTLILPSFLVLKYFSEYFKPYKRIYLLAYKGLEEEQIKKQVELIELARTGYLNESIKFFEDLYKSLNWKKDRFIEKINELNIQPDKIDKDINKESNMKDVIQQIKNRVLVDKEYDSLMKDEKLYIDSDDEKIYDTEDVKKDFLLILSPLEGDLTKKIEVAKNKCLLKINDSKELSEVNVKELKVGDLIVLIQGDERKSFIDYIAKRTGIDEEIDLFHIKNWKDKLNEFMDNEGLDEEGLFELYIKFGGETKTNRFKEWKDSVQNIAPLKKEDLMIIGKIIKYDYLIENLNDLFKDITKIRVSHRLIGREINRLIKEKLSGQTKNLSFDEYDLSNQFDIFRIEKIKDKTKSYD